jgi:transcriptional regulator with XRE-family HTH domain
MQLNPLEVAAVTFAQKLRQLRDSAGVSEARLAAASGVPFGTVHEYGLGRRKPSFAAVVKLAKALGVTCEAFAECDDVVADDQGEKAPARGRPPKAPPSPPPAKAKRAQKRKGE